MSFLRELLGRPQITLQELKLQLIALERERRKQLLKIRRLKRKQEHILARMKLARKHKNHIEVDYLWEELKQLQLDAAQQQREGRIINLETITLKKYVRALERLENPTRPTRQVITALKNKGLDTKLQASHLADQQYLDELQAILDAAGLQEEAIVLAPESDDEPLKAQLLAEIDAIIKDEAAGRSFEAHQRENLLKHRLTEQGSLAE